MAISNTTTNKAAALKALSDPDKAVVTREEKTTFVRPITEEEKNAQRDKEENQNTANTFNGQSSNQSLPFNRQVKTQVSENRLAQMFDDLVEWEEEDNETFYAIITRKQDMMGDDFKRPAVSNIQLPPLQFNSGMMLQFVNILLKANGKSGGRFDIVVTDAHGALCEGIGINGLCLADPYEEEKPQSQDNSLQLVQMFQMMREEAAKDRDTLIAALKPQEDEFVKLAKEKLRNDILNPKEASKAAFDPQEMIGRVMETRVVMEAMATGFSGIFSKQNPTEGADEGFLKWALGNEMLVEKAVGIYEHTTELLADVAGKFADRNPQAPQQNPPIYQEENTTYPPIGAAAEPTEEQRVNMERQQIIKNLLDEVESDRPLDATNEMLATMKTENPEAYDMLLQSCKQMPLEMLLMLLKQIVPEISQFYGEDTITPNERGVYALERLKVFYEYMKTL